MPNKTQLSPEGAVIAQAVARRTGLATNVLAPAMRLRETAKEGREVVDIDLPDPSRPFMTMDMGGQDSTSLVCNDPVGLLLGMHITHRDGIEVLWTIVARRSGVKLWTLDYASESDCELEIRLIRVWLDSLLTGPDSYPFPGTTTTKLTLFNPQTGQEL